MFFNQYISQKTAKEIHEDTKKLNLIRERPNIHILFWDEDEKEYIYSYIDIEEKIFTLNFAIKNMGKYPAQNIKEKIYLLFYDSKGKKITLQEPNYSLANPMNPGNKILPIRKH